MKSAEGWAIKYNTLSKPMEMPSGRSVIETVMPGAFASSVAKINTGIASIVLNLEHNADALNVLGITGGNVRLEHRSEGVYAYIDFLDDSISDDVFKRVQAGFVNGFSIEFKSTGVENSYELQNGNYLRKIHKAELVGLAITSLPAYDTAKIVSAVDTMKRSITKTDIEIISKEIEVHEATEKLKLREHELWLIKNRHR